METMTTQLADLQNYWTPIAPIFSLRSEADYDTAVVRLNSLIDEVGANEKHPLYSLLDTLGTLIHTYEAEHHAIPNAAGPEVLQFLMEEHNLTFSQLPEIGDANLVERYLSGEEELSITQVRAIAKRFGVSPSAFIYAADADRRRHRRSQSALRTGCTARSETSGAQCSA
jgi:HTH-type transcriptional regulator / antitoxin HigA